MFLPPKPDVERKMKIATSVETPHTNSFKKFLRSTSKKMSDIKEKIKEGFIDIMKPRTGGT